jgi:uncharacterized protein (TIRG00374 family)
MSSAERKSNSPGSWLPGAVISILVILAFILIIDWSQFRQAVAQIPLSVILWLFVLTIIPLITRSMAWRSLLNKQVPLRETFFGENIGYLINNFLPLRAGEIARGLLLAEKIQGGFAAVLPSIFLERLIDMGFAAITLLVALPFVVSEKWMWPTVLTSLGIVTVGAVFLYLALKQAAFLEKIITKVFSRWLKFQQWLLSLFHQFIDGLTAAAKGGNAIRAVGWLLITWICYWISFYILILAIEPDAKFVWALFTDGVVSLGIAIPSAPGSLGIWEASFVAALAVFGINQSRSLAVALVMHLMSYVVTGIFGIIGFMLAGSSLNNLLLQVQQYRRNNKEVPEGE